MPPLVVRTPGAKVHKRSAQLVAMLRREELARLPLIHITRVELMGQVEMSTPAFAACFAAGIEVLFMRRDGHPIGRIHDPASAERLATIRVVQYRRLQEEALNLYLARMVVLGKLNNQRVLLLRQA